MNSNAILDYHQRTKHQLNAYAKGPASLDWEDQPNAFRIFEGCETVKLGQPGADLPPLFSELDQPRNIAAQAFNLQNMGLLLELAFGLSAWKQYGPDRWALRNNPSSGNLHPTEAYIINTGVSWLSPGVYHYVSYFHHLERRYRFDTPTADNAELYIGLSSVHWREAWKYGERAFRYCQHDIGHALAALSYAAACLGWQVALCDGISDRKLANWLGLDRRDDFIEHEYESADLLCRILPNTETAATKVYNLSDALPAGHWSGKTKPLNKYHFYRWQIIDQAAENTQKPETVPALWLPPEHKLAPPSHDQTASRIIRQRRSAQHFNAKAGALPVADFYRILQALLPNTKPPFTSWNWSPCVDLFLFVHRVDDMSAGLYWLPRRQEDFTELRALMSKDFVWEQVSAPFDLYLLTPGNVRQGAKTLSCHQAIASDSAFSLGMLADFSNVFANPWHYRRLFWECGMLGQILYLEAEAAGVRGTGIGCFFDDAVHGVLGLNDTRFQSLYHFTVGSPLTDERIQTLPAYAHLS